MKIIHTSDWHIGQIFYEHDRTDEHEAFFKKLADIVRKERPDALLVSGDIFDSAMPSAQNQRLYTDSILCLMEACPGMTAVITAGNHDSGSRLETVRNLWEKAGVKVVGCLSRDNGQARYSGHIFRIPSVSGNGEAAGYVIALPHIYKQNYPVSQNGDRQRELYRKLMETVDEENSAGLPVVMMAHLAVSGSDISGHGLQAGGMDYVPADIFPEGCSYVALGHIHKPQTLHVRPGRNVPGPVVRYCGSPLPLSFDEVYRHSVSIVEISEKKEVKIREEEIPCIMPALTVPENPVPFETALKALKDFPAEKNAYIRLNVQITDYLPQNASIQAAQMAEGKKCKYCGMKITRSGENRGRETKSLTVDEIKAINPIDVAKMFYRKKFGIEMNAEMEDMLNCVIEEISEEKDERK